jgi:hypothetical protein
MNRCPVCGKPYGKNISFVCEGCKFPFCDDRLRTKGYDRRYVPSVPVHTMGKKEKEEVKNEKD